MYQKALEDLEQARGQLNHITRAVISLIRQTLPDRKARGRPTQYQHSLLQDMMAAREREGHVFHEVLQWEKQLKDAPQGERQECGKTPTSEHLFRLMAYG